MPLDPTSYATLRVERDPTLDGLLTVTLDRPDKLNALNITLHDELQHLCAALETAHDVRVVHPVPLEKWIVRVEADKNVGGDDERVLGRRKSPLRGRVEDAFEELVSLRGLLAHPRFSLEILLTREEEVRRHEVLESRRL